jgi:hypothetical protein
MVQLTLTPKLAYSIRWAIVLAMALSLPDISFADKRLTFAVSDSWVCNQFKIITEQRCRQLDEFNSVCFEQTLTIAKPDGSRKSIDLLHKESIRNLGYHATSYSCSPASSGNGHMLVVYNNGGNCNDCEFTAVLDLGKGKWMKYGNTWRANQATIKILKSQLKKWEQSDSVHFINEHKAQ